MYTGLTDLSPGSFAGLVGIACALAIVALVAFRNPHVARILLAAVLIRAALALVHHFVLPLPDSQADAQDFESMGWVWSQDGLSGVTQYIDPSRSSFYASLIAVVYALTERSPLLIQAINVLGGSLIVYHGYLIAEELWDRPHATRTAWVLALFPTAVLYSTITLREVAVVYPFTFGVYCLVRVHRDRRVGWFVGAMISFAVSAMFHAGMVFAILAAGLLFGVRALASAGDIAATGYLRRSHLLSYVAIILFAAGALGINQIGLSRGGSFEAILTYEYLSDRLSSDPRGNAAYLQGMVLSSPVDLVWQTPIRSIYFLLSPFPWDIRSPAHLIGLIDALLYLGLAIAVFRSRRAIWENRAARGLAGILLVLTIVFAFGTSNFGTAMRHRAKVAPLLVCLAAPALAAGVRPRSRPSAF